MKILEKNNLAAGKANMSDLRPFNPEEKVIEYLLAAGEKGGNKLVDLTVKGFAEETSRQSAGWQRAA